MGAHCGRKGLGKCLASCGAPPHRARRTPARNPSSNGEKKRGSVLSHHTQEASWAKSRGKLCVHGA